MKKNRFQTLEEAQEFLLNYSPEKPEGETYTLARMFDLLQVLGNPQNDYKVVHVAGTSGKTSTSYMIRNLLEESGIKTGLTVSPHIESIAERVQVSGEPIKKSKFLNYLDTFMDLIEARESLEPTYFELIMAFAYWVFKKESVKYAVIETGLGGLKDASNVVLRKDKINVITPIGLDHTNVLGKTIKEIARQKAGIIHSGQIVFSASQDASVVEEFNRKASKQTTDVKFVDTKVTNANLPVYQRYNAGHALEVFAYIQNREDLKPISAKAEKKACAKTPPGRFEIYKIGNKQVILDGAHNPQKLAALNRSLKEFGLQPDCWLVALVSAPEYKIIECIEQISTQPGKLIFTEFSSGPDLKSRKSVTAKELASKVQNLKQAPTCIRNPEKAVQEALNNTERLLVVTGSLYLIAAVRPSILKLSSLK